jgi:cell division septation protein DedD
METGPVKKRPSADAAARILRQDANAGASAKKQAARPGSKNAQPAPSAANATPAETSAATGTSYLYVKSFLREDRAKEAAKTIEALGMPADVSQKHVGNADVYIVYSGPYPNAQVASAMQKLEEKGFSNVRSMPVPASGRNANQ